MELFNAEALILDVADLHEYDRIVIFITAHHGKTRGVARGARRKYSRFGGQLQLLAKAKVTWLERENRDLVRLSSVELRRSAHRLQGDLEGLLLSTYLADHVMEFAQENEANERLFRLLDTTIEALLAGVDRDLATRYFEAWTLRLAGVFAAPTHCPSCGRELELQALALPRSGEGLICKRCARQDSGPREVSAHAVEFLLRIQREDLRSMQLRPPQPSTLKEVEDLCTRVRRSFLQHELNSYRVIRETTAGLQDDKTPQP